MVKAMTRFAQTFATALALGALGGCALLMLGACGGPSPKEQARQNVASPTILTVGASAETSAKILEDPVRKQLEALGYELNVELMSDPAQANQALANQELDAVYMEHEPYLLAYNERWGSNLLALGAVHFDPLGLYSASAATPDAVANGTTVALPSDPANRGRALLLLEQAALITLAPSTSHNATQSDIVKNPKDLVFVEVASDAMAEALQEGQLVALTVDGAMAAELSPQNALALESTTALDANTYATVLVTRANAASEPKIKALYEALASQATWNFITATFNGALVPVFTVKTPPSLAKVSSS